MYIIVNNITSFLFLLLGFFIGSFLNVLADRLPNNRSILGRSECEYCHKTLSWKDLIPLFSFVYLKGNCRYCHKKLSFQYPLLEIITGLAFSLIYLFTIHNFLFAINFPDLILTLCFYLVIVSCFIVVFFADLKFGIIPDEVLIVGGITTAVWLLSTGQPLILSHILSAFFAFLFFLSIFLLTRGRGMGFGDVKLAFLMGLILGPYSTALALYIAFLTGGAVGIILILWKKKKLKSSVPFGPFLILGSLICLFFAPLILEKVQALLS